MSLPLPTIASRIMTTPGFSFPKTLGKLEALILDPSAVTEVTQAVVASDPMLTALVLGQANQANATVTQLSEALSSVGLNGVLGLVRGFMPLPDVARDPVAGCWQLANACAIMTRLVARQVATHLPTTELDDLDDQTLMAAGLLHDLGSALAVVRFAPEYGKAVARLAAGEGPFNQLLKQELGVEPSDLGYLLAKNWNLPPILLSVIRFHERPAKADQHHDLVAAVHIARLLVRACGFVAGPDRFLSGVDGDALSRLNIRLADYPPLLDRFLEEWEAREMYEVGAR